jgi:hypothetical protein
MGRYQHALLGGLFIGVLSSLPVVGGFNLCCCLWVVVGGGISTYLLQQNRTDPVDSGEAVLGGLLAGLLGALIQIVLTLVLFSVSGSDVEGQLRAMLDSNPQITPEVRDMLIRMSSGRNMVLLTSALSLVLYPLFGMLGALLGVAIFKKKAPPAVQS